MGEKGEGDSDYSSYSQKTWIMITICNHSSVDNHFCSDSNYSRLIILTIMLRAYHELVNLTSYFYIVLIVWLFHYSYLGSSKHW